MPFSKGDDSKDTLKFKKKKSEPLDVILEVVQVCSNEGSYLLQRKDNHKCKNGWGNFKISSRTYWAIKNNQIYMATF
jgi:hypothetical protein